MMIMATRLNSPKTPPIREITTTSVTCSLTALTTRLRSARSPTWYRRKKLAGSRSIRSHSAICSALPTRTACAEQRDPAGDLEQRGGDGDADQSGDQREQPAVVALRDDLPEHRSAWPAAGPAPAVRERSRTPGFCVTSRPAPRRAEPEQRPKADAAAPGRGRTMAMATGRMSCASVAVTAVDRPLAGSIIWYPRRRCRGSSATWPPPTSSPTSGSPSRRHQSGERPTRRNRTFDARAIAVSASARSRSSGVRRAGSRCPSGRRRPGRRRPTRPAARSGATRGIVASRRRWRARRPPSRSPTPPAPRQPRSAPLRPRVGAVLRPSRQRRRGERAARSAAAGSTAPSSVVHGRVARHRCAPASARGARAPVIRRGALPTRCRRHRPV